ncbi:metal-dependent hydrolase [Thioalkalivibrio sp. ALMg11]|uniref:metal-dependent hydrolase n=1 Tax=Thioalkalivibrio sp. ALMg11 TaxID=1158165 RepID=UPI000360AB48|nr:metal-dependent hydrolase [Thioalkalivibrio sp. ALMg11]
MKSSSHKLGGIALGGAILAALPSGTGVVAAVAAYLGSTAPDALEIPRWKEEGFWPWSRRRVRHSAVPHRTATHWLAAWVLLALAGVIQGWPVLWGFALGGLLHVTLDWLTPMGIPVWRPDVRHSLRRVSGPGTELLWLVAVSAAMVGTGLTISLLT